MADTIQLSRDVRAHLDTRPILAKRLIFLNTASDRGANNQLTKEIASRFEARKEAEVLTYEFPESLGIPHDMIDPAQPSANTEASYSKILELVEM
jgi:hypothetical protein